MVLKRFAPIVAVVALVTLLVGCNDINHVPVITGITATPNGEIRPGTTVTLKAQASDEDGDALTYSWTATSGQLSGMSGDEAVWTAPAGAASSVVSVSCSDGRDGVDTDTYTAAVRDWMRSDACASHGDSVYIPNPGTVETTLEWEEQVDANALVDSALVAGLELEPDELEGEDIQIWVITPSGTQVLLWDRFPGQPLLDDTHIQGIAGEPANGAWKVKVVRLNAGPEACMEDAEIEVFYRY